MPLVPLSLQPTSVRKHTEYREMLTGERPNAFGLSRTTGGGGGGDSDSGGTVMGPPSTPLGEPTNPQTASTAAVPTVTPQRSTTDTGPTTRYTYGAKTATEGLISPVEQEAKAAQEETQGLVGAFQTAAGNVPDYMALKGPQVVQKAVQPGSSPEEISAAKNLANYQYKGPTGLQAEETAALTQKVGAYEQQAKALQTGAGVTGTLQEGIPGLTPGEASFEAQTLLATPEYRQRATQAQQAIGSQVGTLTSEMRAAEEAANARTAGAQNVQDWTRSALGEIKTQTAAQIQAQVAAEQAKQAALQEQFNKFMETGDVSQLDPSVAEEVKASEAYKLQHGAEFVYKGIMQEYGDIEDIPFLQLSTTSHGRENYSAPGGTGSFENWVDAIQEKYGDEQGLAIARRVVARQRELESAFSPGSAGTKKGEYSAVAPLYFSETGSDLKDTKLPFMPGGDLRQYAEYDMGQIPSFENMSTEEQRYTINTVNEIIDDLSRIEAAGEPYRAAMMAVDVDKFLSDQEAQIAAAAKTNKKAAQQWINDVKHARKKYRKAQEAAMWGQVMMGVAAALTYGTLAAGIGGAQLGAGTFAASSLSGKK